MITRVIAAGVLGLTSCAAIAAIEFTHESATFAASDLSVADTNGRDRRDDRQDDRGDDRDDRQDCREDDGLAGKDKRDCKQDNRHDSDD
jgi:hypothetical protein